MAGEVPEEDPRTGKGDSPPPIDIPLQVGPTGPSGPLSPPGPFREWPGIPWPKEIQLKMEPWTRESSTITQDVAKWGILLLLLL